MLASAQPAPGFRKPVTLGFDDPRARRIGFRDIETASDLREHH